MNDGRSTRNGDRFDFDSWITQNGLNEVKNVFIKHNMCSLSTLSVQSYEFPRFIAAVSSENARYVQQIVAALQALQSKTMIKKIKATDEEFAVEELIEDKVKELNTMKQCIEDIYNKYMTKKDEKYGNIKSVEREIENKFNEISLETERQKNNIFVELSEFKENDDIKNKMEILKDLMDKIEDEKQFENKQLNHIRELFQNENIERKERKIEILEIGDNVKKRYENIIKCKDDILENDDNDIDRKNIGIYIDDKSYKKLMKYIEKIGKLKYREITDNDNNNNNKFNMIEIETKIDFDTNKSTKTRKLKQNDVVIQNQNDDDNKSKEDELNELILSKIKHIKNLNDIIQTKDNTIIALRAKIENNLNEYNKNKQLFKAEINEKAHQIKISNEKCDRLINDKQNDDELINKYLLKINKMDKNYKKLQENYDKLINSESELNEIINKKQIFIEELRNNKCFIENKLHSKRNKIKNLENRIKEQMEEINELKMKNDELLTSNEGENCWKEIEIWSKEMDHLRNLLNLEKKNKMNELKSCKIQICDLQKKIKFINNKIKLKDDEIKKLRTEINKQRNINNNHNKNVVVKNNENKQKNKYLMKVVNDKKKQNKQNNKENKKSIISKIGTFDGNNGKQFVEEFCKISKYGKPKIETKLITKSKNCQQIWQCFIEIKQIGLKQEYKSKQKKIAIYQCYQKLAAQIYHCNN